MDLSSGTGGLDRAAPFLVQGGGDGVQVATGAAPGHVDDVLAVVLFGQADLSRVVDVVDDGGLVLGELDELHAGVLVRLEGGRHGAVLQGRYVTLILRIR